MKRRAPGDHARVAHLPERVQIIAALERLRAPQSLAALATHFGVANGAEQRALERRLLAMTRDGQLIETRNGAFGLASRMDLIAGEVLAHRDGYAFVRPDQGGDDIYLAFREARRTLHGDRVLVRVAGYDQRNRPYGHVVEVLARAHTSIVGRYFRDRGVGVVVADSRYINQDILIPPGAEGSARQGQIVVATLEQQPDQRNPPIGRISEVLGEHMAPGMEIEIAIRSHQLPEHWPAAVVSESARVAPQVGRAERAARVDLRELALCTIDGADARDFDDAVHARKTPKGYVLHVAIADVAHYVTPGSALDAEARRRGTSVYFPERVIPMLPEALSNGICSLNPDVERLAMVCEITFDAHALVRRARFYPAVIRSQARLIYEDVESWYRGARRDPLAGSPALAASIECLYDLYDRLRAQRVRRGALDIDTMEARFQFGSERKIERIEARARVDAHRLIEECMIAANVEAARFLLRHKQPGIYRNHEPPQSEKVEALATFLHGLGLRTHFGSEPEPAAFAAVLAAARTRLDRRLIDTVLLRSLKLAVYDADNRGHFGLALPAYAHFTSPIRRYPDLVVHRAIKAALAGCIFDPETALDLAAIAHESSSHERRADEATREVVAWLKCEFMRDKQGHAFSGIVSGVAEFGVFVELDGIFVEGLIHVSALPSDYYRYDAVHHVLRGRSSRHGYRIGQALDVVVARVDLDERKIDFALSESGARRKHRR